ncbi:MAG: hypothetical protein DI551_10830, partial [Micavibrio aeruginosavorus]
MKIKAINAKDVMPVKVFEVSNLTDIVVIAGANGVGKTRLINAVINKLRGGAENISFIIEATIDEERKDWGKSVLDTSHIEDQRKLLLTLQKKRYRSNLKSTVILFESNRGFDKIKPLAFAFSFNDPYQEETAWDLPFSTYTARRQDTFHSILKKVQGQNNQIADKAKELMVSGEATMDLDFPDPLEPFKKAFSSLLSPKKLIEADLQKQTLFFEHEGQKLPLEALSSGEREVVNITFDLILRNPSDAVIVFDEPEVHLHPELVQKLVQTLATIGERNQFIFCTH